MNGQNESAEALLAKAKQVRKAVKLTFLFIPFDIGVIYYVAVTQTSISVLTMVLILIVTMGGGLMVTFWSLLNRAKKLELQAQQIQNRSQNYQDF